MLIANSLAEKTEKLLQRTNFSKKQSEIVARLYKNFDFNVDRNLGRVLLDNSRVKHMKVERRTK